jgi:hypothetical protein
VGALDDRYEYRRLLERIKFHEAQIQYLHARLVSFDSPTRNTEALPVPMAKPVKTHLKSDYEIKLDLLVNHVMIHGPSSESALSKAAKVPVEAMRRFLEKSETFKVAEFGLWTIK